MTFSPNIKGHETGNPQDKTGNPQDPCMVQIYTIGSYGKFVLHPEISQTFGGGLSLSGRCFFAVLTFLTCRRPLIRLRICLPLGTRKRAGTNISNTSNTVCTRSIRLFLVIQSDLLRGSVTSNQGGKYTCPIECLGTIMLLSQTRPDYLESSGYMACSFRPRSVHRQLG